MTRLRGLYDPKSTVKALSSLPRPLSTAIVQLRAGHSPLNAHLFWCKRSPSPNCDLCGCPETVDHFLLICQRYNRIRSTLSASFMKKLKTPFPSPPSFTHHPYSLLRLPTSVNLGVLPTFDGPYPYTFLFSKVPPFSSHLATPQSTPIPYFTAFRKHHIITDTPKTLTMCFYHCPILPAFSLLGSYLFIHKQ